MGSMDAPPPRYPKRRIRPGDPYADAAVLPGERDTTVDVDSLFPGTTADDPVELEIGGGRGAFAFERVAFDPKVRLIGLEVRRKWAAIVDRKLVAAGLGPRTRVFAEDARLAMPRLKPDGRLRAVFMHFPDPWWKKRHEKRLVLGDVVQREIERLLRSGGELFVQTDVEHRFEQYKEFLDARELLEPFGDEPGSARLGDNPYGAQSPREKRAIADGMPIHRLRYRRR
jgi:tRNA (guanine-N7-)-methyltransferase